VSHDGAVEIISPAIIAQCIEMVHALTFEIDSASVISFQNPADLPCLFLVPFF
jgi:hypothetical protein